MSKNSGRYSDIIDLPHHQSIYRPHMTVYNRAAQFAPFAALTGYAEMVEDTASILLLDQKMILDEDRKNILDKQLQTLILNISHNPKVKVLYFDESANKLAGAYVEYSGIIRKIERDLSVIVFIDGKKIMLADIVSLDSDLFEKNDI